MSLDNISERTRQFFSSSDYLWKALDWLYPPKCCGCQRPGVVFCDECKSSSIPITGNLCISCGIPIQKNQNKCQNCAQNKPTYTQMRSWAVFEGVVREAIHSLKYKSNLALGRILAEPLCELVLRSGWKVDLIIPIPLSKQHQHQRGYNQAEVISLNVAKNLNIPHSSSSVKRIRETQTQISLGINERFTNLDGAFTGFPAKLNERSILIIDDVVTTGATMQSCSKALINAGASQVYCLSVARALRNHS